MPIVVVPQDAAPGVLNSTTMVGLEAICDVGSRMGVRDGSVAAWIQVSITPHGVVRPDAYGRFMHLCVEFTRPEAWIGKRRQQVPGQALTADPRTLLVECDPGTFWIGTFARFYATGGVAGDQYNVTMTEATMQQLSDAHLAANDGPFYQNDLMEPAFQFRLTALSMASEGDPIRTIPGPAAHHSAFRIVEGQGAWGGVPVLRKSRWLPLSNLIVTGTSTIYQTGGAV